MNSSAGRASGKWSCGPLRRHGVALRGAAALALAVVLVCGASLNAVAAVPLPKPRPQEAPARALPADQPAEAESPDAPAASPPPADAAAKPEPKPEPKPPPLSACRIALTESIAIAPSIPPIRGPGACGGEDLVRLEAVVLPSSRRVALKPAAVLRCTMASAVADWVRTDMEPFAASLGTSLSEVDNYDSYECRGRNRVRGAKLSEHGLANAIDIRGFKFANGTSLSLTDRQAPREALERVLNSVCSRFATVLGPGSDWYHEEHIHLDLAERRNNYKLCQWGIFEPLPVVAPLMPAARPEEAPSRKTAEELAAEQKAQQGGAKAEPASAATPEGAEGAGEEEEGKPAEAKPLDQKPRPAKSGASKNRR